MITERVGPSPGIALDRAGKGAPLVVFLHGIGGNRTNYAEQLEAFAPRCTAVAWDARGYGASDDYEGPLDFADVSDDLARVLDHFGAAQAVLVGLSMGGRIAQDFYARRPQRVAALVLCCTHASFGRDFTAEERAEFLRLRLEPLARGKTPADIAPALVASLAGASAGAAARERLAASIRALRKESYVKALAASVSFDRSAELERIRVPTLVVAAEEDRLTRPDAVRRLAGRIPGAEFALIERAGHLVNIERPDEFNRRVLDFLERRGILRPA